MTTATSLEARLIRLILNNQFNDSGAVNVDVWTFSVYDAGWNNKQQFAGVVSSAVDKGFVKSFEDGAESTMRVTDAGRDAYLDFMDGQDKAAAKTGT